MRIRFYNARIITFAKQQTTGELDRNIIDGELWTEDNKIIYVGKTPAELSGSAQDPARATLPPFNREIDVQGNLILPGFKDAHTHSAMTFLRSYADDLPLLDWLHQQVFPLEAKLQPQDVYWCSRLAVLEYLSSGITTIFDMYFYPENFVQAMIDSNYRAVLVSALNNFYSSVANMEEEYHRYNNTNPLISYFLGFHAEYTTSLDLLRQIAALANKLQAPVYMHSSESAQEVKDCLSRYELTPTVLFDRLGIYNYGGGAYHCIHMSDEDLRIFKERKLSIVTNPASNCKLASGIAPVCKILEQGINLAIGTDGPASNNALDMFREMFLVTALAKIREKDAACVPAQEVLQMACVNGAEALNLKAANSIQVGKLADLIILDLQQPNMQPLNNIVKNVVYSGSKSNVLLTMVDGKILYEKGQYAANFDVERIYYEVNKVIKRVKS